MTARRNGHSSQSENGFFRTPPFGQIAQLVEQRTENPRVGSSILPLATPFVFGFSCYD